MKARKKLKLLLFDINYTRSVNRGPLVVKIKGWQEAGIKINIFTNKEGEEYYKRNLKDINYHLAPFVYKIKSPYSLPWQYLKANIIALPYFLKLKRKYDLLYTLATLDFLVLPYILKFFDKKVKWFAMVDNLIPLPWQRPGDIILKTLSYLSFLAGNWLLKKTEAIFVVTDEIKNYFLKKGIKVIKTGNGYGIETELFQGKISKNVPKYDILYCGRIHPAKGIFDLVKVIKIVVDKNKNLTCAIMGDGDEATKLKLREKIDKHRLKKNIFLIGYKAGKRKADIYRNCGCFLFLSYDEGLPQVATEALASNKQVIAYDLPIYREVYSKFIKSGEVKTFPIGRIGLIADFILKGDYNRKKYKNNMNDFTWDKIIKNEILAFKNQT